MGDPMRIRATEQAGVTEVRILMKHEMESGQRKDSAGKLIPPHFIQTITVKYKGKEVFSGQIGAAISKDPYFAFKFKGGVKGEKVVVTWSDNKGDSRTDEAAIV